MSFTATPRHAEADGIVKRAFGDSCFFFALLNPRDQDHFRVAKLKETFHGEWNYSIAPLQQQLKM